MKQTGFAKMDGRNIQSHASSRNMSLNDNLTFLGKELHVQTENVQTVPQCIRTHVFYGGRVIHTMKYEFSEGTVGLDDFDKIRAKMQVQHRQIIEKIIQRQKKYQNRS